MSKKVKTLIVIAVILIVAGAAGTLFVQRRGGLPGTKYPLPAQIADNKTVTSWGFQASGKVTAISGTKVTIAASDGSTLTFDADTTTLFSAGAFFAGQAQGSLAPFKNEDIKVGDNITVGLSLTSASGTPKAGIISFSK